MGSADLPAGSGNRRDFLTGRSAGQAARQRVNELLDQRADDADASPPSAGGTIRLSMRAMACEFSVIMNPGPVAQLEAASAALELLEPLEHMMTVYRADSELSLVNQAARQGPVSPGAELFELLRRSVELAEQTEGTFDPTSGPLIQLWRDCRHAARLPSEDEVSRKLERTGVRHVVLDKAAGTVAFLHPDAELNLGGVGKGYALDRLQSQIASAGFVDLLLHGGHSSIIAHGQHAGRLGWPVGIRNPLFPRERWATVLLQDCALSSSGSNIQFYRQDGRRWGHILDPRTGWPAEQLLSCTVLAPTAERADALSTAFFVGGVEFAQQYCDNHPEIQAILMPPPRRGRTLEPIVCGLQDGVLFVEQ